MLPPSIMGAPPCLASNAEVQDRGQHTRMIKTPAVPRRTSPRVSARAAGLTQQQKAQARLAKQVGFIDDPTQFSASVRQSYINRFKVPLGKMAPALAKAVGVHATATISLPEEDLLELAGDAV